MDRQQRINPGHRQVRKTLRIAGVIAALIGLTCIVIGTGEFVLGFGSRMGTGSPKLFWLNFVGAPILFVGLVMLALGFTGAVARYQAAELAPVAIDTANEVSDAARPAVRAVAQSVVEGIRSADADTSTCPSCGVSNDGDASYCDACGVRMDDPSSDARDMG
ncbi:MAG: hypothetical protein AAFX05_02455 [Planctomycetota bacterium]